MKLWPPLVSLKLYLYQQRSEHCLHHCMHAAYAVVISPRVSSLAFVMPFTATFYGLYILNPFTLFDLNTCI